MQPAKEMPGDQDIDQGVQAGSSACHQVLSNVELAATIFCCLEDIALSEVDYDPDEDEIPFGLPDEWQARFVQLALVNRAFFHASMEILWKALGSLEPLLALLEPDTKEEGEPATYSTGVSPEAWERFDTYSRGVKILLLKANDSPRIDFCWFMFISTARNPPGPLLPSVKTLTIQSSDDLSIFLAFTLFAQLESLTIDIPTPDDGPDVGLALSAGLAAHSHLTTLHFKRPCEAAVMRNISQIRSLTSLHINIKDTGDVFAALKSIESMEMLETLVITQSEDDADIASQFPSSLDISAPIARASRLTRLRKLEVTASGTTQFLIAAELSPRSLEKLMLKVLCGYETPEQMVLVPLFLAIHVSRNPGSESISVDCQWPGKVPYISPGSVDRVWNDPQTKAFLTGLGALDNLKTLYILRIPLLFVDIRMEILKILPKLRRLEDCAFQVASMVLRSTGGWPLRQVFEEVERRNPQLEQVKIPLGVTASSYDPDNRITILSFPRYLGKEPPLLAHLAYPILDDDGRRGEELHLTLRRGAPPVNF